MKRLYFLASFDHLAFLDLLRKVLLITFGFSEEKVTSAVNLCWQVHQWCPFPFASINILKYLVKGLPDVTEIGPSEENSQSVSSLQIGVAPNGMTRR